MLAASGHLATVKLDVPQRLLAHHYFSWLLPDTFTSSHSLAYSRTPHGVQHPVLHTRRCTGQAFLWQALEQKRP